MQEEEVWWTPSTPGVQVTVVLVGENPGLTDDIPVLHADAVV